MTKKLPKIIEAVGFDFHWDSRKVWELDEPVVDMDINELLWHFEIPFWGVRDTDDYNLTPWEIIKAPGVHSLHYERVEHAAVRYPIDIMKNKGKWLILDGLHRLVKLYLDGARTIKVRIIPRTRILEILKDTQ